MRRLSVILMVLFVVSAIVTTLNRRNVLEQESAEVGQKILVSDPEPTPKEEPEEPLFPVRQPGIFYTLGGEAVKYEDLISYPKVILVLWTSKCDVCNDMLVEFSKDCFSHEEIKLVFVNLGESKERVKRFVDYYKLKDCATDRILLDREGYSAIKFFVANVPTIVFFEYGKPVHKAYTLNKYLIDKVYEKD